MSSRLSNSTSTQGTPRSSAANHTSASSADRMDTAHMSTRSDESSSPSIRNSSNARTLNFFRNIVGQKHADYHSDAPQTADAAPSRVASTRTIGSRGTGALISIRGIVSERGAEGGVAGWCSRSCACFAWPPVARHAFWNAIIRSTAWQFMLIVLTIVLLFGAQVRDLWIPKAGDDAVDYVFLGAFIVFTADILIRIDVEPNYFCFAFFCWRPKNEQMTADMPSGWVGCGSCRLGSFLFWCDVVSTLTLLYEISFINSSSFEEQSIRIDLNAFGIPVAGLEGLNESTPVQTGEVNLLVTIAKTARVARFIRSSTAVKISSSVNWYWLFKLINPLNWWNCCMDASKTGSGSSRSLNPELSSSRDHTQLVSWGGLGLGALATVKAQAMAQENANQNASSKRMPMRAFGFLGRGRNDDENWHRQLAATKIQCAWRNVLSVRNHDDKSYATSERSTGEAAWGGRVISTNNMDRALKKRSFLNNYGKMNIHSLTNLGERRKTDDSERDPSGAGGPLSRMPSQLRNESQVGSAMRELTGQRVAIGIIIALVLTVLFTYTEGNATRPSTMIVLFNQTGNVEFASKSLDAARSSSIPDLFEYKLANNITKVFDLTNGEVPSDLRDRETLRITVSGADKSTTTGMFAMREEKKEEALVLLLSTIFILLVWFFGVTAFAGPVMILVVIPIERMVRLLGMLMLDPLGYQSTSRYKRFVLEEDEITKNTRWSKEVLKGMETSFLMSTILRIGSLMKVGFGSAGVEIIRKNLEKGQSKNMLILNSQGSTVSCIFLFCDIRQFTDATECLQEEVFVFTNKIAAVVHSICHSYGGSANKNVGDAFLLSWLLDDYPTNGSNRKRPAETDSFTAKSNQADKALLSVVKICMALQHDDYYIEAMSDGARDALLVKLKGRKGPVVQMGFGLHAGKAVQGAIGSQRKIDATYVSEAVERAEFLESSTKQYGLKMLMSDAFHRLLHPSNRRRCRKVDQILFRNDEDDDSDEDPLNGDIMELLTFDMDIEALWKNVSKIPNSETGHESDSESGDTSSKRNAVGLTSSKRQTSGGRLKVSRRLSTRLGLKESGGSDEMSETGMLSVILAGISQAEVMETENAKPELVLPTGPALYNTNVWVNEDMRRIRQLYSDGLFFQKFYSGLQSFYAKDWEHARQCFVSILERFEDGPSRYFLTQIESNNGKPPRDFLGYGTA